MYVYESEAGRLQVGPHRGVPRKPRPRASETSSNVRRNYY